MPYISPPSHLRGPAALTPDKNLLFRGPFHNQLLIIIYKTYDLAYNAPILVIFSSIFHSYHRDFFSFWSNGGPPAGGGPRHVPIVPRP